VALGRLVRWAGIEDGPGETDSGRSGPVAVGARRGDGMEGDEGTIDGGALPGPVNSTTFSHFLHLKREAARP
jgi:hypothetical protein